VGWSFRRRGEIKKSKQTRRYWQKGSQVKAWPV